MKTGPFRTQLSVALELGVSHQAIQQIEAKVLTKVRRTIELRFCIKLEDVTLEDVMELLLRD